MRKPNRSPHGVGADPLELYRWATQDPETQIAVLDLMHRRIRRGPPPRVLREDFAGTAAESIAWVDAHPRREAIAVERDPATVDWARLSAEPVLGRRAQRLQFITSDVLEASPPAVPPADLIAVLNFSICYFHRRTALLAYLRHARRCLAPTGLLVLNLFGGPGARRRRLVKHAITPRSQRAGESVPPPFEYQWEQRSWRASTRRIDCRIHFVVPAAGAPGRRMLRDAFRYDWRLWRVDELIALLRQAGFADAQVWRHTAEPGRGRAGVFLGPVATIPDRGTWVAYLVGIR